MDYDFAMFSFIFLIVKCNAVKLSATEKRHDLSFSLFSNEIKRMDYTAEINKPLEVHFQNVSILNGWCVDFYDPDTTLEATVANYMIHIKNVTYSMSTLWKCSLEEIDIKSFDPNKNLPSKYYVLFINLHVKGAKSVEISINGKDVMFSEVDLSVPYDGDTVYLYEDGEHVHVVCRNPQRTGIVYLEYLKNVTRNASESATFDIQLHSGSNHSYIDCVYNTAKPADKYVYRVTFVIKKPSFHSNESNALSATKLSSPVLLGSSIGAVFVLLAMTGVAYYCVKTRNTRHVETPYGDLTNKNDNSTSQTNEYDTQYDTCYATPETAEDMGREEHYYTKIDYSRCKPKVCESQTRKSLVYDEPYVHITLKNVTYVNITTRLKA